MMLTFFAIIGVAAATIGSFIAGAVFGVIHVVDRIKKRAPKDLVDQLKPYL